MYPCNSYEWYTRYNLKRDDVAATLSNKVVASRFHIVLSVGTLKGRSTGARPLDSVQTPGFTWWKRIYRIAFMAPHFEAAAHLLDECDSVAEKRGYTRLEWKSRCVWGKLVSNWRAGSGFKLLCNLENLLRIGAILYRVLIFSCNFFSLVNWIGIETKLIKVDQDLSIKLYNE